MRDYFVSSYEYFVVVSAKYYCTISLDLCADLRALVLQVYMLASIDFLCRFLARKLFFPRKRHLVIFVRSPSRMQAEVFVENINRSLTLKHSSTQLRRSIS